MVAVLPARLLLLHAHAALEDPQQQRSRGLARIPHQDLDRSQTLP